MSYLYLLFSIIFGVMSMLSLNVFFGQMYGTRSYAISFTIPKGVWDISVINGMVRANRLDAIEYFELDLNKDGK